MANDTLTLDALAFLQAKGETRAEINGHKLKPWFSLRGGVMVAKTKCKHCGAVVSCHVNDDAEYSVGAALTMRCTGKAA